MVSTLDYGSSDLGTSPGQAYFVVGKTHYSHSGSPPHPAQCINWYRYFKCGGGGGIVRWTRTVDK